jgi:chromosome segregation ATPase
VALIGLFFHVIRDSRQQDVVRISTIGGQFVAQGTQLPNQNPKSTLPASRQTETNQASVPAQAQEVTQVALASAPEARQIPTEERAEALAQELTEARRAIQGLDVQLRAEAAKSAQSLGQEQQKTAALAQEVAAARQELTAGTAQHRQALDEEGARSVALASELAVAQLAIEAQAALLRKMGDETGQFTQAEVAKSVQSLEQEQQKTAALAQEAAAARQELIASTEQHRQALDEERARRAALWSELAVAQREIEMQAAQLRNASDETRQLKQATESAMVKLRQSLQQERDRTAAIARDLDPARRTIDVRVTSELAANSPLSRAAQAVEVAAMAPPAAVETQSTPEATRLIARASALLGQGDIGAARTVLERATETGSAQASFMLAETYDPGILSAWGTYGTRGEVTKARELYAKAHAGGIQEAKNRIEALDQ